MQKRKDVKAQRAAKRAVDRPFQVSASVRDATIGQNLTEAQVFEGRVILVLILLFSICLLEGLIVGASVCILDSSSSKISCHEANVRLGIFCAVGTCILRCDQSNACSATK
jgi:hypothetical protein